MKKTYINKGIIKLEKQEETKMNEIDFEIDDSEIPF